MGWRFGDSPAGSLGGLGSSSSAPSPGHPAVSISPVSLGSLRTGVASVISVPRTWHKARAGRKAGMESTVPGPPEVSRSGGLQGQSAGSALQTPGTRLRPQSFQGVSS